MRETLSNPLRDFDDASGTSIGLASEVLGAEWRLGLSSETFGDVPGAPLRVGSFVITDEHAGVQGGFGLRIGDQLGVGFDALWFLDLDQAQIAMGRLLLDVNTKVELGKRLDLFGGLALDYRPNTSLDKLGSQASAGLRVMLRGDLYFIAEYSMANPFSDSLPHWQSTTLGLSLGDVGLILLGMQAMSLSDLEGLELTGEFIYRF